jgi:hypothetical protein
LWLLLYIIEETKCVIQKKSWILNQEQQQQQAAAAAAAAINPGALVRQV